jgi:hypothetical protein
VAIVERDPWRMQYFEGVACPPGLFIPTEDPDAWVLYPEHRWVYDKLRICATQDIPHGPHGIAPTRYPVFSKPIYNLKGMGIGIAVFHSAADYERGCTPGHLWMQLLEGEHVSTDVAVIDAVPHWWRHTTGVSLGNGVFDYWTVEAAARPDLEATLSAWLRRHLRGFTGVVNFETIGGAIIECHLRFADQWPDLNGAGWLDALVQLYARQCWSFADGDRRTGYSVVLFGPHGPRHRAPPPAAIAAVLALPGVSSVQITFCEEWPLEAHAMPPGGFRLAIVNCWDLEVGLRARAMLAREFPALDDEHRLVSIGANETGETSRG